MKVVNPIAGLDALVGLDSGMRSLRVTKAEAAVLMRAAEILERGHDLLPEDHQSDYSGDEVSDALCLAPPALRRLATSGLDI